MVNWQNIWSNIKSRFDEPVRTTSSTRQVWQRDKTKKDKKRKPISEEWQDVKTSFRDDMSRYKTSISGTAAKVKDYVVPDDPYVSTKEIISNVKIRRIPTEELKGYRDPPPRITYDEPQVPGTYIDRETGQGYSSITPKPGDISVTSLGRRTQQKLKEATTNVVRSGAYQVSQSLQRLGGGISEIGQETTYKSTAMDITNKKLHDPDLIEESKEIWEEYNSKDKPNWSRAAADKKLYNKIKVLENKQIARDKRDASRVKTLGEAIETTDKAITKTEARVENDLKRAKEIDTIIEKNVESGKITINEEGQYIVQDEKMFDLIEERNTLMSKPQVKKLFALYDERGEYYDKYQKHYGNLFGGEYLDLKTGEGYSSMTGPKQQPNLLGGSTEIFLGRPEPNTIPLERKPKYQVIGTTTKHLGGIASAIGVLPQQLESFEVEQFGQNVKARQQKYKENPEQFARDLYKGAFGIVTAGPMAIYGAIEGAVPALSGEIGEIRSAVEYMGWSSPVTDFSYRTGKTITSQAKVDIPNVFRPSKWETEPESVARGLYDIGILATMGYGAYKGFKRTTQFKTGPVTKPYPGAVTTSAYQLKKGVVGRLTQTKLAKVLKTGDKLFKTTYDTWTKGVTEDIYEYSAKSGQWNLVSTNTKLHSNTEWLQMITEGDKFKGGLDKLIYNAEVQSRTRFPGYPSNFENVLSGTETMTIKYYGQKSTGMSYFFEGKTGQEFFEPWQRASVDQVSGLVTFRTKDVIGRPMDFTTGASYLDDISRAITLDSGKAGGKVTADSVLQTLGVTEFKKQTLQIVGGGKTNVISSMEVYTTPKYKIPSYEVKVSRMTTPTSYDYYFDKYFLQKSSVKPILKLDKFTDAPIYNIKWTYDAAGLPTGFQTYIKPSTKVVKDITKTGEVALRGTIPTDRGGQLIYNLGGKGSYDVTPMELFQGDIIYSPPLRVKFDTAVSNVKNFADDFSNAVSGLGGMGKKGTLYGPSPQTIFERQIVSVERPTAEIAAMQAKTFYLPTFMQPGNIVMNDVASKYALNLSTALTTGMVTKEMTKQLQVQKKVQQQKKVQRELAMVGQINVMQEKVVQQEQVKVLQLQKVLQQQQQVTQPVTAPIEIGMPAQPVGQQPRLDPPKINFPGWPPFFPPWEDKDKKKKKKKKTKTKKIKTRYSPSFEALLMGQVGRRPRRKISGIQRRPGKIKVDKQLKKLLGL